jgi:hypothetical protein
MSRRQPFWYNRWYGAVMIVFDSVFHPAHIINTFVLAAFNNPGLSTDGVHLTESSGLA